jgi:hypothetical protein
MATPRSTCFLTDKHAEIAQQELTHRRRAQVEDRVRCAKDTGLKTCHFLHMPPNQVCSSSS